MIWRSPYRKIISVQKFGTLEKGFFYTPIFLRQSFFHIFPIISNRFWPNLGISLHRPFWKKNLHYLKQIIWHLFRWLLILENDSINPLGPEGHSFEKNIIEWFLWFKWQKNKLKRLQKIILRPKFVALYLYLMDFVSKMFFVCYLISIGISFGRK